MRRRTLLAIACWLGGGLLNPAAAQFSPGKLARAHAQMDGPTSCLQCHEPRKATTHDRCLACHVSLGARIAQGKGFHGRIAAARRSQCGTCHVEHGGADAALVRWPGGKREALDHAQTGFELRGAHAKLDCAKCHSAGKIRDADVRADKSVRPENTYLGLAVRCAGCHEDPHHDQFSVQIVKQDCAACHDETRWKIPRFDHAAARFPLTGKHTGVACAKCHYTRDAAGTRVAAATKGAWVQYRPVEFASCTACHKDPHQGQLGSSCVSCHSTADWKRVDAARFDHSRTRYPLTGKHANVECSKCHYSQNAAGRRVAAGTAGSTVRYKPLGFASCTECHKDPHQNRFGADCTKCHSTAAWSAIPAGAFDHDKTDYPLRGAHRKVECEKCHRNRDYKKAVPFARCTDCHRDAHRGELAARADKGACESCHTVDRFSPAHFTLQQHDQTRFALRDAHRAVFCAGCHKPQAGPPRAPGPLHFADISCTGCHADPHAGQFAAAKGATDCARCHGLATWKLPRFDHAKTRFALDGAHARAACAACHRPLAVKGKSVIRYRPLDTACRSCHAEERKNGK